MGKTKNQVNDYGKMINIYKDSSTSQNEKRKAETAHEGPTQKNQATEPRPVLGKNKTHSDLPLKKAFGKLEAFQAKRPSPGLVPETAERPKQPYKGTMRVREPTARQVRGEKCLASKKAQKRKFIDEDEESSSKRTSLASAEDGFKPLNCRALRKNGGSMRAKKQDIEEKASDETLAIKKGLKRKYTPPPPPSRRRLEADKKSLQAQPTKYRAEKLHEVPGCRRSRLRSAHKSPNTSERQDRGRGKRHVLTISPWWSLLKILAHILVRGRDANG